MKNTIRALLFSIALPTALFATGQEVRFSIAVHSETAGGGSNGIPVTPDFRTTDLTTYLNWRSAILSFASLCQSRSLDWGFETDWNFAEGVVRFEMPGGAGYDAAMQTLQQSTTAGKNVLKYLHENMLVNLDPHSHETGGYNYADVAYLLDVKCDTEPTLVVGGHVYTGNGYQNWPKFTAAAGLKAQFYGFTTYYWKPHLLMGGGTAAHVSDPHVAGLWRPQDSSNYLVHSNSGLIAAVGNWEQDFVQTDRLLRSLEDNSLPHANKLWTVGRVFNHRDMVLPGYLTATAPAILDTIAAWRDAGRFQVRTFEAIYTEWLAAPYNGASSIYLRPEDNMSFSMNWQDFAYPDKSIAELRTILDHHESLRVPIDVFLTTWQTDILETQAPDLLGRLFSSRWVNMGYHVRPPKPYANNFVWKASTSADIAAYESYRLNMTTGDYDTSASGGYAKLTALYGAAPSVVGANADTAVSTLVHSYFQGAGAKLLVYHNSSAAVNIGTVQNGIYVRPETYDWRLIETFNGTSSVDTIDEALTAAHTATNAQAPYFTNAKLHDNDVFATESAWLYVFSPVARPRPYDISLKQPLLDTTTSNSRRTFYLSLVTEAASRRNNINLLDARDMLSLLANESPRPLATSVTKANEEQPGGTVLAEITGGGIESGLRCTYTLVSGTGSDDNADFAIVGNTLTAARRMSYESNATRHFRLRWSDGVASSGERAMTLVLANITNDDDDGDGFTEAQETLAGTDPLNSNSRLRITSVTRTGSSCTVTWSTVSGKSYRLESSLDLATWQTVATALGTGTFTISGVTASQMFYRIAVE